MRTATIHSPSRVAVTTDAGVKVFTIRNEEIELCVVPAVGAKVISLRNLQSGREWFYSSAKHRKIFTNQPGDDFAHSPVAGWDECLPTIAPCHWDQRALPDHGEVWAIPWVLDETAWRQKRITTYVRLPLSPLRFTRTIAIESNVVLVDYDLENLSETPQSYLWAMHPLLAVQAGDQLELPPEAQPLLATQPWLQSLEFGTQATQCAKAFVSPLRAGRVAVCNRDTGDRLAFSWDARVCPALGIWLTRGGWHGHHHLALEPTTTAHDSLAGAASDERGLIRPRRKKSWRVQLQLTPPDAPRVPEPPPLPVDDSL